MNRKKTISLLICFALIFSLSAMSAPAAGALAESIPSASVTAVPSDITLILDGEAVQLSAYNIGGSNYFRLRDLACILNGTEKQFEVTWDEETKTASMISGAPYSVLGDEAAASPDNSRRQAIPTIGAILLDENSTDFVGYGIEGSNYFKLRDIMSAVNVGVTWDEATHTISLNTAEEYVSLASLPVPGTALLSTEAIAEKAAAVVTLYTYDEDGNQLAQGSGFFIRENGWIASCYHVFSQPFKKVVAVADDGTTYTVHRVLAYDVASDLIIVQANGVTNAAALALGSPDSLIRGQQVMVISSPFNMRNTVSSGIVSAFRTDVVLRSEELTDIQITVPVSSGSSGGPMLDMYGNVKGIIYAKHLLAENANFAIPIGDFYPLLEHISPLSFEEMQSQVAAAIEAAEAAQSEPSSCTQSAAVSYID